MADIERWITMNGAHIPIIKGESRTRAVANFVKSKRESQRKRKYDEYFKTADKATAIAARKLEAENEMKGGNIYTDDQIYWDSHDLGQEVADMKFERKYGKNWNKASKHNIKGRAKTKDEIDEARYVEYKNLEDNALRELERANGKRAGQLFLASHHADNKMQEKYKTREWGDTPNKSYKLKAGKETPAKRAIKGVGKTDTMKQADKSWKNARDRADKRTNERLKNGNPMTLGETWDKYKRSYKAANTKRTKAYTYKMTDDNRRKMINDLGNKVTKLDRQVENAKTDSAFRRLQKKEERTQKAINTFGGKYIVGRKKKK